MKREYIDALYEYVTWEIKKFSNLVNNAVYNKSQTFKKTQKKNKIKLGFQNDPAS